MATVQPQNEVGLKESFFRDFQIEVTALQKQIENLNQIASGGDRNDAIDQCLAGIDRLSHEVKDASSYIPAYDQRSYSQTVKGLAEKLQAVRNSFNPPKKFAFKSRKNAPPQSEPSVSTSRNSYPRSSNAPLSKDESSQKGEKGKQEVDLALTGDDGIQDQTAGPGVRKPSFSSASKVTISNHKDLRIVLPASASHATSSGTISNLQHCTVDLSSPTKNGTPFAVLYLKNIKDSVIICGQSGPAHITDIQNSVIVASCRQFRMHSSKNVVVYLHCSSRPIIEDCRDIKFAPLPDIYVTSELSKIVNHWDQIDDFDWLKVEPSPHYSFLSRSEWPKDKVWEEIGSDEQHSSMDDTLKILNVQ